MVLVYIYRYGLSWNPNLNGHLLSASDDHVSNRWNSSLKRYVTNGHLAHVFIQLVQGLPSL